MASTSYLPLVLGEAVLGRTLDPDAPAPEKFTDGFGQCWELVTDPAILQALEDAKEYARTQDGLTLDQAASAAQDKADAAQDEAVRLAGIAATEADEALEAALGEMVSDKSNVFIQAVPPVEEMRKAGVLWIDTSPVTVDGQQIPGNIPKTWGGASWVAVTDSAVAQAAAEAAAAHAAAADAADEAADAMAEARYAPRIADRPPSQADGVDKPAGAGWHEYAQTTNYQGITANRLVQTWRWDGATWQRLDMDPAMLPVVQIGTGTFGDLSGDRLNVTGKLTADIADVIDLSVTRLVASGGEGIDPSVIAELASQIITSGLFRTDETGQRLEIDSNGLVMWGIDPDGVEYEMVRIGPSGANLLTVGSAVISPESVSAPSGQFSELTVAGQDITTILEPLPRGRVAQQALTTLTDYADGSQNRVRATFLGEPGRRYVATVAPFYTQGTKAMAVTCEYACTAWNRETGAQVWQGRVHMTRHSNPDANPHTAPGATIDLPVFNVPVDAQVTLSTVTGTGEGVRLVGRHDYPVLISIDDLGMPRADTGTWWTYGNLGDGSGGSGGGDAGGSTPVTRYGPKIFASGGYGGDLSSGDVVQGYYSGVGMRSGGWVFNSQLKTAIAGATLESLEIYLKNDHWYYGAGGTAVLRPNDGTYKGTVFGSTHLEVPDWPRYQARWVKIPSSWLPHIAAGTYGGISVQTSSTSGQYYGRFDGDSTLFRAVWRK